MTHKEKNAILIVTTILVIAVGRLIVYFNFISQSMWSALNPEQILKWSILGMLVITVTLFASRLISSESQLMQFSWLKLIPPLKRYAENIAVLPAYLFAPLAITYMLVLTYALPIIAFWEEWIFRGRINGLLSAVIVTLAFGLIHFLVGASLGGSLVLVIPGGFFALVYSIQGSYGEGLLASTYLHAFYDVLAIVFVGVSVVIERRKIRMAANVEATG